MVMNDMTDDGKWGAEIAVDGDCRPAFVADDDRVKPIWRHGGEDNTDYPGDCIHGWGDSVPFIRLPADHLHYRQSQTLTAQEHLARMEAFVRKAAAHVSPMAQYSAVRDHLGDEARALVAEMEPVDPDLAEANKIAEACGWRVWEEAGKHGAADWEGSATKMAYDAIKRGRELARGDVA